METLWFVLVAFMLAVYVLLDGFDLGAGAIHLFVAKSDDERRTVLQAIGPVWDGNEVWLLAAGGTLFFAFPVLYASSFSGFYLPLIIVVWLLMLRGAAIELRSHVAHPLWRAFWDSLFFLGSGLLAVFFGAALGNVTRGVPLDASGYFFESLWTNFNPRSSIPGILDWYTVLTGLLALAALIVHGASYLVLKTEGAVNQRAMRIVRLWAPSVLALTVLATIATFWLRPPLLGNFSEHPWGYIFPLLAVAGLAGLLFLSRPAKAARRQSAGRELALFASSCAYIAGMLTSNVFAIYPNVLPAIDTAHSLTIHNAAASNYGMAVGLVWWLIGMALAAVYFAVIYRLFRGKVRFSETGY